MAVRARLYSYGKFMHADTDICFAEVSGDFYIPAISSTVATRS